MRLCGLIRSLFAVFIATNAILPSIPRAARASDNGTWIIPSPPVPRRWHSAALDAVAHRMVIFGGETARADLWTLSLDGAGAWTPLNAVGTVPSGRGKQLTVLDRARNRMLVLGGNSTFAKFCDVWALQLTGGMTWSQINALGSSPCHSIFPTAVHDALNNRVVVFGGWIPADPTAAEVWTLDITGTQGTQGVWASYGTLPGAPSAREGACSIYDPLRQRMIVLGGNETGNLIGNVWALSLGASPTWSALSPSGTKPPGRRFATAVHDPIGDRLLLFGGLNTSSDPLGDVWALNLSGAPTWSQVVVGGPSPAGRHAHAAVFDSATNAMVVHGGQLYGPLSDEAWKLSLSGTPSWTQLGDVGLHPANLTGASILRDASRDELVVFAGGQTTSGSPDPYSDVWSQPLAGGSWVRQVLGPRPGSRTHAAVVLDPLRDELVVFGGSNSFGLLGDLWIQSRGSGSWGEVPPSPSWPLKRWGAAAIHDPVHDRMLMFGGVDTTGGALNELWQFSLGSRTWTQLTPGGGISPRNMAAAVHDPIGDRMLVFGGSGPGGTFNDLHQLSLAGPLTWSSVGSWTTPPSARFGSAMAYDTARNRVLMHGGARTTMAQGTITNSDLWEFTWGATPKWTQLQPTGVNPGAVREGGAIYDPMRDQLWSSRVNGMVRVAFPSPTAVEGQGPGSGSGLWASPNPASTEVRIEFTLASQGHLQVTVVDVTGRLVRVLAKGIAQSGNHTFRWDGRTPEGERVPPGLYFYEVSAPGSRQVGRVVLLGP